MNQVIPLRKLSAACAFTCVLLTGFTTPPATTGGRATRQATADSIVIETHSLTRSHKVTLYPDASQKVIFFSVKGRQGQVYNLYLFDLDGHLVKQSEIRNRQTTLLKNISKGIYVFEVFSDDDRIGSGHLTVK